MMRLLPVLVLAIVLPLSDAIAAAQMFVVFFGTGEDHLTAEAEKVVAEAAAAAHGKSDAKIEVAGYGDDEQARDKDLAARRAAAVVRALAAAGVAQSRIETKPGAPPAGATGIPVHKVTVTLEER
jgi:outer membrane protein OmpA-like peptidoglycan-associated protein